MNYNKKSNFRQLAATLVTIITAITISFGMINLFQKEATAQSLPLLNSFQHGFSNDISWNTTNFGGAASAKIIAGPWAMNGWSNNNNDWLTKFKEPVNQEKVPYIYMYQVAGKARADWGLQDCNVGAAINDTLCARGAEYIRQKSTDIAANYTSVANQIKQNWGTTRPIMIHMEPDFYQYAHDGGGFTQLNGPITQAQAHTAMNQWTNSIKTALPNAVLVMDISPWNSNLASWSNGFKNFDYAGMVGKRFSANGDNSFNPGGIDGKTYAQMSQMTGKKLIINDAHGAGGAFLSYGTDWENRANVQARWSDGVVAVLMPPNDNQYLENTIQNFTQNPVPASSTTVSSSSVAVSSSSSIITSSSSSSTNVVLSSSSVNSSSAVSSFSVLSSQSATIKSASNSSSISVQSSNSSSQSSLSSSNSSSSSVNPPSFSSTNPQSSSFQASSQSTQNSWLINFQDGQRAEIELLNSDCRFKLLRELPTQAKFIEFRGVCNQTLVKTYWLDLDPNKNYKLVKFNPINNSKTNFNTANIGKEIKNGKYIVTSIHKIVNNGEGDYDPTNGIWDPYTLELISDNIAITSLPLASNSPVANTDIKVINLKLVGVKSNNAITNSNLTQSSIATLETKTNITPNNLVSSNTTIESNTKLQTIQTNNSKLNTVRTGGYSNWLSFLILPSILAIHKLTRKKKLLD